MALLIHANERHYEFIGHTFVVEILHALHGIGILPAFAIAEYHGTEGFGDSLPPAVTIHRVVASTHARDLTRVVLTHLLLQLLQVAGAAGRQGIAPIHECMHEDAVHIILLRHFQESVKVGLMGMHATVRNQTQQMQLPPAGTSIAHSSQQRGIRKKIAVLNHQLDASAIHNYNAPGADVEVSDLAVAHLPFGKADIGTAGVDECVGMLAQQPVVCGLARERDSVGFGLGTIAPAIEDDEDEWSWSRHKGSAAY